MFGGGMLLQTFLQSCSLVVPGEGNGRIKQWERPYQAMKRSFPLLDTDAPNPVSYTDICSF
ncbi:hypothetical protein [uncultured Bacteroides sp.]|uniref:hypothetical protein n=1 Tax=uncultured Bacteroides sp. TaxID=162156 RepID=UPI0026702D3D|nr:hypothetical protein [uncultured Bacteroides sp.]